MTIDDPEGRPEEPLDDGLARRILDALPEAVCCKDLDGRILYWNAAAERLTGYPREEAFRPAGSIDEPYGPDDAAQRISSRDDAQAQERTGSRGEDHVAPQHVFLRRPDGRRIWIEVRGTPLRDAEGRTVGRVLLMRDATSTVAIGEALRQARRAAESDPLTGLANRRHLDRMLEMHAERLAREGRPFCLMVADLDHFKSINDAWGHAVGDRALVAFAELLQNQSRAEDLVVRYGGEEFVVLLPDHSLDVALRIAERFRAATPSATPPELGSRSLTASFGVAEAAVGEPPAELLQRADAALYRAKSSGRNRVEAG